MLSTNTVAMPQVPRAFGSQLRSQLLHLQQGHAAHLHLPWQQQAQQQQQQQQVQQQAQQQQAPWPPGADLDAGDIAMVCVAVHQPQPGGVARLYLSPQPLDDARFQALRLLDPPLEEFAVTQGEGYGRYCDARAGAWSNFLVRVCWGAKGGGGEGEGGSGQAAAGGGGRKLLRPAEAAATGVLRCLGAELLQAAAAPAWPASRREHHPRPPPLAPCPCQLPPPRAPASQAHAAPSAPKAAHTHARTLQPSTAAAAAAGGNRGRVPSHR
jgi:hypothetical protein